MAYNFLREAKRITNSNLCRYDTLDAFVSDFSRNGDIDGWDIYNNVYLYGCWNNTLFGTSYSKECFIQRTNPFFSVAAEDYYIIELILKITPDGKATRSPTTGKVMWLRTDDNTWDDAKSVTFELEISDNWQKYRLNLGPERWWQGNINNLRIYPFIDGHKKCSFAFKSIKITSVSNYTCNQTSCDYYTFYSHPCPAAGQSASSTSANSKEHYTTVSGVSDELLVNIDDYGDYRITLGNNIKVSSEVICQKIEEALSSLSIGGYAFVNVYPTLENKIRIQSGTTGSRSSVVIAGGTAATELGFIDVAGNSIQELEEGKEPASHFDYAASVRLSSNQISRLLDDDGRVVYEHNPLEYNVEAGNKDFYYDIASNREDKFSVLFYNRYIPNSGTTIVDLSHPVNNNGKITDIYLNCGKPRLGGRIYILSPKIDGTFRVVDYVDVPTEKENVLYTTEQLTQHIKCDFLVTKGDVLAVYNLDLMAPISQTTDRVDARYFKFNGKPEGEIKPENIEATGVVGFQIYARSNRLKEGLMLEFDFGSRINLNKFMVRGTEHEDTFEYNIAICEDISWKVDCRNETHLHTLAYCNSGAVVTYEHRNIPYGIECLSDGILTPDGGQQGTFFSSGSDGIITGGQHSYFYVNGDGEWDFGTAVGASPIYEFYNPPFCSHTNSEYIYDPIHFILDFPKELSLKIHKTKMYFKEAHNFKHFYFQYYVGESIAQGTGLSIGYYYIPGFESIRVDSILYDDTFFTQEKVPGSLKNYLFNNPTGWPEPIYTNETCINWDIVQTARDLNWTVLEHNFKPVEANGFRFVTDLHYSTKMTEFEVYSKIPITPSLVDNASVSASTDGAYWYGSVFKDVQDDTIESDISISPRYLRVVLQSESLFSLESFVATVTDSVVQRNCDDTVNLDFKQLPNYSEVSEVLLTNTFNSIADLNVTLPSSYEYNNKEIASISFKEDVDTDDVIIYKNNNHPITLEYKQIANNCKCYGLHNLVDGKNVYIVDNLVDFWTYYRKAAHAESLELRFTNKGDMYIFETETLATTLLLIRAPTVCSLNSISLYKQGTLLYNYKIYLGANTYANSLGEYIYSKGYVFDKRADNTLDKARAFDDTFDEAASFPFWDKIKPSTLEVNDLMTVETSFYWPGKEGYSVYPSYLYKDSYVGLERSFAALYSFELDTNVFMEGVATNNTHFPFEIVYVLNYADVEVFRVKLHAPGISQEQTLTIIDGNGTELFSSNIGTSGVRNVIISRKGASLHINVKALDGTVFINNELTSFTTTKIDRLKVLFKSELTTNTLSGFNDFAVESIHLNALNVVSSNDCILVELFDTTSLDVVSVLSTEDLQALDFFFLSSFNSKIYSASLVYKGIYPYVYKLAIDLESYHSLMILRNYGDLADKLFLTLDSPYVKYSNTDTDDITQVDWGINYDVSLFRFSGINGSTVFKDDFSEDRVITPRGAYISTQKKVVLGSSCYFDGSAYLELGDVAGDYDFQEKDFGILFYTYFGSNIYEEKILLSKWSDTEQSFLVGVTSDKELFFRFKDTEDEIVEFRSNGSIAIGSWTCVEVSRHNWYVYIFINGMLDSIHKIGQKVLKTSTVTLCLGGILFNTVSSFYGYIDNLHIRNGHYIHISNYDLEVYLANLNLDTYDEFRWLLIELASDNDYTIDKLGVYPDVTKAVTHKDTYNCIWDELGSVLTSYDKVPLNIAPNYYRITATSQVYDCGPEKAVSKDKDTYEFNTAWGFDKEDAEPTLTIMFDQTYYIDTIKLYSGIELNDGYLINDYDVVGYTTASGTDALTLISVTDNTAQDVTHKFDPLLIHKIELRIKKYTSGNKVVPITTESGVSTVTLDGGFLREIEVYTSTAEYILSSENYPVVCFNLNYQFNYSSFSFFYSSVMNAIDDTWLYYTNNKNNYIYVSDNINDYPEKVPLFKEGGSTTYYYNSSEINSELMSSAETEIATNVYFDEGVYDVSYQMYDATDESAYIIVVGPAGKEVILPNVYASDAWATQHVKLVIKSTGLYTLYFIIDLTQLNDTKKAIKELYIYRNISTIKWFCTVDNTATDYSTDVSVPSKPHYMKEFKLYGTKDYFITEYDKWWSSNVSTLSLSPTVVREQGKSLKIEYPSSTEIDYVCYREADSFVKDPVWLEKDYLAFWLYIDDVSNLDLTYGGIGFGNPNGYDPNIFNEQNRTTPIYAYGWELSNLTLKNGWNYIKLKFSEFDAITPLLENNSYIKYLDPSCNLRNKMLIGFIFYYRGNNSGPITMYLDGLKIERCKLEEYVHNYKALCLSYNEFAEVNLSNLTIEKGTISMYLKMYNDSKGLGLFNNSASRTIFSIISSNNDILTFGVRQGTWFEFGVGDAFKNYQAFALTGGELPPEAYYVGYDESFHVTVMWDNQGHMSNGDSFRLYLNGDLVWYSKTTWEIQSYSVTKLILGGGAPSTAFNNLADGAAVFGPIKVYNYCLETSDYNRTDSSNGLSPNDFVYISTDGVNYYGSTASELPLTVSGVQPGESVKVYIKAIKDSTYKQLKDKTAELLVDWVVAI